MISIESYWREQSGFLSKNHRMFDDNYSGNGHPRFDFEAYPGYSSQASSPEQTAYTQQLRLIRIQVALILERDGIVHGTANPRPYSVVQLDEIHIVVCIEGMACLAALH